MRITRARQTGNDENAVRLSTLHKPDSERHRGIVPGGSGNFPVALMPDAEGSPVGKFHGDEVAGADVEPFRSFADGIVQETCGLNFSFKDIYPVHLHCEGKSICLLNAQFRVGQE